MPPRTIYVFFHFIKTHMKFVKKIFSAALLGLAIFTAAPQAEAAGPFRFGIKAGVAINDLKFNEDAFNANNRTGFTGGLTAQFVVPLTGIGCDISAMYTHRSNRISVNSTDANGTSASSMNVNRDYLEIPVNFRWEINIIGINKIVAPFITTGPDFSFLMSKQNVNDAWKEKKFDLAWNFGFGLQFVQKVQIAASYGLGLTKSASGDASLYGTGIDSKNRFWTVTAAYLF